MSGYKLIHDNTTSGNRSLYIMLYPHESSSRPTTEGAIADALANMGDQLISANSMDNYWIHSYTNNTASEGVTDPSGGRSNDYFDDFKQFIDNSGGGWGVHLGVTSQTKYAEAQHAFVNYNAWGHKTKAYVGTKGGYDVTDEDKKKVSKFSYSRDFA